MDKDEMGKTLIVKQRRVRRQMSLWLLLCSLTLLSGDVRLVPELGRVLDKFDIHLYFWIAVCLDEKGQRIELLERT